MKHHTKLSVLSSTVALLALSGMAMPPDLELKEDPPAGGDPAPEAKKDNAADTDNQEIKGLVTKFMGTFEDFKKKHDEELAELKKTGKVDPLTLAAQEKQNDAMDLLKKQVEDLRLERQRPMMADSEGKQVQMTEEQVEHKQAFADYFMTGDPAGLKKFEGKSLSVGVDPDGGYLAPTEVESTIDRVITETSPMRQVATVRKTGAANYKKPINLGGADSGWVGEKQSRKQTDTPELALLEFGMMELYAMPAATATILEDAATNVDAWLADEVNITMAVQEGQAYIHGDGVNKPRGILGYDQVEEDDWKWGKIGVRNTGEAADFASGVGAHDNLVDLIYSTKSTFRGGNARFLMNRKSQGRCRKIRDGDGNPMWQPGLQSGQPASLMGYSISEMEDMPDFAAGTTPIAFGDFKRGYLILDRRGVRVLRDPYSAKPYVLFYTTKRVGGGVQNFDAYKLLKCAA